MKGLFVTATDTNVGKTWVGSQLVAELMRQNVDVQARKPIESGWPIEVNVNDTDAWKLATAMGDTASLDVICPNRFKAAISPDRAAMLESADITLDKLHRDCLIDVADSDFLYVEGAGGFYSPICKDGLNADLAVSLKIPVLLIVEDRLGCINQALLNVEAIQNKGLQLVAIVLNKSNKHIQVGVEAMNNLADIRNRVTCEVISFDYNQISSEPIKQLAQLVLEA